MFHMVNNIQQKFVYYLYKSFYIKDSVDYFNEWFDNNKLSSSSWDREVVELKKNPQKTERICHVCNKGQKSDEFHIIVETHFYQDSQEI